MIVSDDKVKFLIIRFSSIGDIVLTTPVIRNLKQQVEGAEIHFLTKKSFASVLEANPYIDKLHVLDNDFNGLMHGLKAEQFDYIIDLHRNLRTARVKRVLKKMSFVFDKLNYKKWLLVNLKVDKMPDVHIVDRYMNTVSPFIEQADNDGLDYFIPQGEDYESPLPKDFVAIVLGANHATKQLPNNMLEEICKKLQKPIVLLGGKGEIDKAKEIVANTDVELINLTGVLSINQSASVIKQADWVITPDTGLMHIAAAFKKKIISVWGNTVPEFGMSAYGAHPQSVIIEQKGLKCRPCSKIGYKKCPKQHFNCMNKHDIDTIVALANK